MLSGNSGLVVLIQLTYILGDGHKDGGFLLDPSIEDALILNADPSKVEEEWRNAPLGRPVLAGLHD